MRATVVVPRSRIDAKPDPAVLGPDLWALITERRIPFVEAREIGPLRSPQRRRAAFRLLFADGSVLKGRRFDSDRHADRFERLSGYLDPRHFPRLVARRGAAVLTEWAEGSLLGRQPSAPLLRLAGALQGALHRTVLPAELLAEARARRERWRPRLERELAELVARGGLDRGTAGRVLALATDTAPATPEVGLGHGDYCPENIVAQGDVLHVVDNESLLVHACDYDLARTWYRWPMRRTQREAFLAGYREHRDPDGSTSAATHWTILVLVDAALFRVRGGAVGTGRPLGRLETLGRRGARPIDARPRRARATASAR